MSLGALVGLESQKSWKHEAGDIYSDLRVDVIEMTI